MQSKFAIVVKMSQDSIAALLPLGTASFAFEMRKR
jgi:hypothetical protein